MWRALLLVPAAGAPSVACPGLQQGSLQVCERCVHDDLCSAGLSCDSFMQKCIEPAWNASEALEACPEDPERPETWAAQCKLSCSDQQTTSALSIFVCSLSMVRVLCALLSCLALACDAAEELPTENSTLKLTCFGWRLEQPELIVTNSGAFLNGVAISDDQLRSIHEVANDLIVTDDKVLTNLDMLAGIQRVGGNVEIRYNSALQDFSGLSGLQSVGGSVNIIGNRGVQDLAGFADLRVIGRFLRVHHNERLELLGGFDSLTRVGRDLSIRGNSKLQSMPRMPQLKMVDGKVEVVFNRAMSAAYGMESLEFIGGDLAIKDNDNLTNMTMLPTVREIVGKFEVSYNQALLEVGGLENLTQIGSLAVVSNPSLKIADFANLSVVHGAAEVMYNEALQELGLKKLVSVGVTLGDGERDDKDDEPTHLKLNDNDNMTQVELPSLASIANLEVRWNAQLKQVSTTVAFTHSIIIEANHLLQEILMPNTTEINGELRVAFNAVIPDISSFNSLTLVKGDINIQENKGLRDMSGFGKLRAVTGDLQVTSNPALQDLSGLSSDFSVGGNLQISENDNLLGLSGMSALPDVKGFAVLSFNCSGNSVRPANTATCVPCEAWHYAEDQRCKVNYTFLVIVAFVSILSFCIVATLVVTFRKVMPVESIVSAPGRVLLRTQDRHYLLRGVWSRDFPLVIHGTGCDLLDKPSKRPLKARAVSDKELEVLVVVEKTGNPRRSMSSLQDIPLFMDVLQPEPGPGFGMPVDAMASGSTVISGQGVARVSCPWELRVVGFGVPAAVWLSFFLVTIAAFLGAGFLLGIEPAIILDSVGCGSLLGAGVSLAFRAYAIRRRHWKRRARSKAVREKALLGDLEHAVRSGDDPAVHRIQYELQSMKSWGPQRFSSTLHAVKQKQSQEAGVSISYLLSAEFKLLAQTRSKLDDPNFYDLKDAFFLSTDPIAIGSDKVCPRDGKLGCALVDVLDLDHRGDCTHFLSWTWGYSLNLVRSSMTAWIDQSKIDPQKTFLYMCFFVNNQYRILLDQNGAGSMGSNLKDVFGDNLQRIGRMVALLDGWEKPTYLSRIWTIFEQYTAVVLEIEVTFILPEVSGDSLLEEIRKGEEGIVRVRDSLCDVDAEIACAWCPEDEMQVKSMIEETIGFEKVNAKVQELMIAWVATMVKDYLGGLVVSGSRRLKRSGARTQLLSTTTLGHRSSTRTNASTVVSLQPVRTGPRGEPVWAAYMYGSSTNVETF
ncbi:hypothetical protein AK812_SmicGene11749 [Symbiodinium microadriaticum]|uniref:Uncharacterized protein n=1 Tax=Symbiodinium microadriaticum TaxID=2951 RepID=A0A1Q9ECL8_SYMMI|nr:hypothetical protein AK812_SmicGene11749 [Symbiodinium microadriaticum]CAE7860989.1 unnamed protein product [Symbiodinium microadriaticum]